MINLTNIRKVDNYICCSAFVEDCNKGFDLKFNVVLKQFESYKLPMGYEWCKEHITMAKRYLKSIAEKAEIPSAKLIMWC